ARAIATRRGGREAVVLVLEVVVGPHPGVEDGDGVLLDAPPGTGAAGGDVLGVLQGCRTAGGGPARQPEPPPGRDRPPLARGPEIRRRPPAVMRRLGPVRRRVEALTGGHAGTSQE